MGKVNTYARTKGALAGRLLTYDEAKVLDGKIPKTLDQEMYEMFLEHGLSEEKAREEASTVSDPNFIIAKMLYGRENTAQSYEYYWLGTTYPDFRESSIYTIHGFSNSFAYYDGDSNSSYYGIRPVLTVLLSDVSPISQ